jgi:ribosomal protein L39E
MFGTTFYHGTTRKLIVAFAAVFNNIHVQRKDGANVTDIKVPIAYESQKKYLARLIKDTKKNRQVPRMGFIMNGMELDQNRTMNQMNELSFNHDSDDTKSFKMYAPIPYNFNFTLDIYVDYMDDGLQIIEQIVPYFQPDFNVVIEEIPVLNIERDVPIVLGGVTMTDEFEGEFGEHRIVNWTLDFVMKGWVYPPVKDGKIIKQIIANYKLPKDGGDFDLSDTTTILEQVKETVDPLSAGVDDVWTTKVEVGHPDDPNDATDVDTMSEVNWPVD